MQATTESSVGRMRALSLKAGITMLYFGYCVTWAVTICRASGVFRNQFPERGSRHHKLRAGPAEANLPNWVFSALLAIDKDSIFARKASFSHP
jgi:hypothetical protein